MKPSNLVQRQGQHIIVFGDPKVGKSTLVARLLLEGFRLTWVSIDSGHIILFKLGLTPEQLDEQLNIIVVPDTKDQPIAINTCLKLVGIKQPVLICDTHGRADCPVCKGKKEAPWTEVDTSTFDNSKDILVFDHIGQTANSAIAHAMIKAKRSDDDDKAEWDDYRVQGTMMDKFLTNVQNASYNIICITHVAETEMEDGSTKLVPLVGSVPFSRNVGKYFDHMVYCSVGNSKHAFGSATTFKNKIVTGSRTDKEIEKLGDKPSLKIFFDGTVPKPEVTGKEVVKKLLSVPTSERIVDVDVTALAPETSQVVTLEPEKLIEKDPAPEQKVEVPAQVKPPGVDRMAMLQMLKKGVK